MSDIAKLGIHVDTSQVAEAILTLNDLADAANRAADALLRLKGAEIEVNRVGDVSTMRVVAGA